MLQLVGELYLLELYLLLEAIGSKTCIVCPYLRICKDASCCGNYSSSTRS